LRSILHLPVPRIIAHSSDPLNAVDAEFIIEEKAEGRPLGSLWNQWEREEQLNLVTQVVDFQKKPTSISFRSHGCLYYKKDLEGRELRIHDLQAQLLSSDPLAEPHSPLSLAEPLNPLSLAEFALGPLTKAGLWEGERATMDLDRGPCKFSQKTFQMSKNHANFDREPSIVVHGCAGDK
jgi:hypothetical protein